MFNFKEFFETLDVGGIPPRVLRLKLKSLLKLGIDNPRGISDSDLMDILHYFKKITGKNPFDVGGDFYDNREQFFLNLYKNCCDDPYGLRTISGPTNP